MCTLESQVAVLQALTQALWIPEKRNVGGSGCGGLGLRPCGGLATGGQARIFQGEERRKEGWVLLL